MSETLQDDSRNPAAVHTPIKNWMITGANGNLGRRLLSKLLAELDADVRVTAVVRSARARKQIEDVQLTNSQRSRLSTQVVDYTDVSALQEAAQDQDAVVHLVGILKETKSTSYQQAHEDSTAALVQAVAGTGVRHISYLSIVGSTPDAQNRCLASKGAAEQSLLALNERSGKAEPGPSDSIAVGADDAPQSCVLRVPMVLGEGDYASFALAKRARSRISFGFRPASKEQPIYAGDVATAIIQAAQVNVVGALDLGGPTSLSRAALTARAAELLGKRATIIGLPIGLGMFLGGLLERILDNPPFTSAMLDVLDHDDEVDPARAYAALQLESPTSLDDMLQAILVPD